MSYVISTEVNLSLYYRAQEAAEAVLGKCATSAWAAAGGQVGDVEIFATAKEEPIPAGATRIPKWVEFSYRVCTHPGNHWPRPVLYARKLG